MSDGVAGIGRSVVTLVGLAVTAVIGVGLFVWYPTSLADLFGVLLAIGVAAVGVRVAGSVASSIFPEHNVAEVAVEGPITRKGGGRLPTSPGGTPADDIVEQIERADEEDAVEALILHLNTPGGEVVPSDDIRRAAAEFDGPTVAYTTDTCASGGYWIASGCDELWARDASLVGSIGVIGSRPNASELAEKLGISYEQLTAGEYKDAGMPLKEFDEQDRQYLQGLIDDYYDQFVDRVAEGREVDETFVRDTEAKIYMGEEAHEIGLVDELGTREDVTERIQQRIDGEPVVEEFEPEQGVMAKLGAGAATIAYAFGAGVASVISDDRFRFRV